MIIEKTNGIINVNAGFIFYHYQSIFSDSFTPYTNNFLMDYYYSCIKSREFNREIHKKLLCMRASLETNLFTCKSRSFCSELHKKYYSSFE